MTSRRITIGILLLTTLYWNPLMATIDQSQLIKIAKNYLEFIHDVGSAQSVQSNDPRVETLFSKDLTKIDNRTVLFENNRDALLVQMKGFEKEFNPESKKADWTVDKENALILPSSETNSVVVYFQWVHVNVGRATTIVILQVDENGRIQCITDVWAKIQNS